MRGIPRVAAYLVLKTVYSLEPQFEERWLLNPMAPDGATNPDESNPATAIPTCLAHAAGVRGHG